MKNTETFMVHMFSAEELRPSWKTWFRHLALLLVTFATTTVAGVMEPFGRIRIFPELDTMPDVGFVELISTLPLMYANLIGSTLGALVSNPSLLIDGLSFSVPLLFILISHEMGHYVMCRRYGVVSTLPFFLPVPPLIGPAGTFGAFIKIKSPLPSRKAVFDIGVAGPIAGFIAIIPVSVIGLLMMETAPANIGNMTGDGLYFSDPLLTHIIGALMGVNPSDGFMNPFLAAAWLGLLVTSLNLIPSGQLDGGHAVYSVFGSFIHRWTGKIAFFVMIMFSVIGWILYSVPGAILFTVLLGFMMRMRHPVPIDDSPLDGKRLFFAAVTLLVFILSFTPFPIKIGSFQ
jgi:membrane-associated protease RseP (regulator of RpoE activity)